MGITAGSPVDLHSASTVGGQAFWHAGNFTPGNYALLTGATYTGAVGISLTPDNNGFRWNTAASVLQWLAYLSGAIAGSNAGDDWVLACYSDTGVWLGEAMRAQRSTRTVTFGGAVVTPGPLVMSVNASYLQGKTSGGTVVNLFSLTSDANNITRFICGVNAGGFQWTDQGQTVSWSVLNATQFQHQGNITAGGFFQGTAVNVSGSTGAVAGSMYYGAGGGLTLWGKTGTTNDFSLVNPAGTHVADVPTGTNNMVFAGGLLQALPGTHWSTNYALTQHRQLIAGATGITRVYEVAQYTNNVASQVGTIKLTLPVSWSDSMMNIRITGYDYTSNGMWELILGGYNYSTGGTWYNCSATLIGNAPFSSVRFAHDGTKCCILLGTTATTWQYPKVIVESVDVFFSGVSASLVSGWSLSLIAAETGITVSNTPTFKTSSVPTVVDDTTTASQFPLMLNAAGVLAPKVSTSKLSFRPSDGYLFGTLGLFTGGFRTTSDRLVLWDNYLANWATNANDSVGINQTGYQGGTTQFRDLIVYDGKGAAVATFTGATKAVTFTGPVQATQFTGMNTTSAAFVSNWSGANYFGLGNDGNAHRVRLGMVNAAGAWQTPPGDLAFLVDGSLTATSLTASNGASTSSVTVVSTAAHAYLYLNAGTGSTEVGVVFQRNGANLWELYDAAGTFRLYSYSSPGDVWSVGPSGYMWFNRGTQNRFVARDGYDPTQITPVNTGARSLAWNAISASRALYNDEEFEFGINGLTVYNNAGGSAVTLTREADATAPNKSGYRVKVYYDGVTTPAPTPGLGGFLLPINSRANAVLVQRFIAKLPVGFNFMNAENSQGTNSQIIWLTPTAGTGKWEEYIRWVYCGDSGTFSSGGHVYVQGSGSYACYLASINIYDIHSAPPQRQMTPLRWFYESAIATTDKQPVYRIDRPGFLKALRTQSQTPGTGAVTIYVNGTAQYTLTMSGGDSATAWVDKYVGQSFALSAGDTIKATVSTGGTAAGITIQLDVEQSLNT